MGVQQGYGDVLWSPSATSCELSNLNAFIHQVNTTKKKDLKTWAEIHRWSVQDFRDFWQSLAEFYQVNVSGPIYENETWFPQTQLNVADYLLHSDQRFHLSSQAPAIISIAESGCRRVLNWNQLRECVQNLAHFLIEIGVQPGDRIAGILPNQLESVISALATAYVGGIWTSCSPDFGLSGLQDRLGQIEPKVLLACDAYAYKGKIIDIQSKIIALLDNMPHVQHLVITPFEESQQPIVRWLHAKTGNLDRKNAFKNHDFEFKAGGYQVCTFHQALSKEVLKSPKILPFSAPLYILYSSGTTGKPKCIVHGAGGTLLQHLKEQGLHTDIKPGEKLFYFSTCGWMMWNWLVSGLGVGATLVLFDGNPLYPKANSLLQLAAQEKIEHFGASAKYFAALNNAEVSGLDLNLSSLRSLLSTGSPLLPETFDYLYQEIKSDVRVASISGGTDIISCFALGNPWLPVRRGELQGPGLGMAVAVLNDQGESVLNQQGELVCTEIFPSQPLGFWNDLTQERYLAAYFSRFEGVWAQGDFAIQSQFGGFIILGRSDTVLNPGGVRIGTAELYRQVEVFSEIVDALAVGKQRADDEEIWLFVQLVPNKTLTIELAQQIRKQIREHASPRHVPAKIIAAPDLPRTRSGKIAELAVKKLVNGQKVDNASSLANPDCLGFFASARDLTEGTVF